MLKVADTHRLGAVYLTALSCGLRLGEVTGLTWDDVNLDTGEIRIRQQLQAVEKRLVRQPLKTEKFRRALMLPDACRRALVEHRRRQPEDRLKAGADYRESGLVFTTFARRGRGRTVGGPLHLRNVHRTLSALLDAASVPRVRFHDLRHSAASLLIAAGVQLAEVWMLLGHAELRTTSDLYAHLQTETAAKAAKVMDAVLNR